MWKLNRKNPVLGTTIVVIVVLGLLMTRACRAMTTTEHATTMQHIPIRPYESMEEVSYPHKMAIWITTPWDENERILLRAPETVSSNLGVLYIDHQLDWDNHPEWKPVTMPSDLVYWRFDPDQSFRYTCRLDNGVILGTRIKSGTDEVSVSYLLVNGTTQELTNLTTQFCLVAADAPSFADPLAERTFVVIDGKWQLLRDTNPDRTDSLPGFIVTRTKDLPLVGGWQEDLVDVPLIATVSQDGKKVLAKAFENGDKIMVNSGIPCLHADPKIPDCAPGSEALVQGKIYLFEGSLDDVLARFYADFPAWSPDQQ